VASALAADGSFVYTPTPGFTGVDSFLYRATDGSGTSNLAMVTITVLGTLGFASVGTILAAVSMNTRMSDVMLPILLLPIAFPVVIGAVESTAGILTDPPGESLTFWIKFLVVFNVIFITLPLLLFDFVLEE